MICPCGGPSHPQHSGAPDYATCCGPRHDGSATAPTAEALMRSRYSAFALDKPTYLAATQRAPFDVAGSTAFGQAVKWLGLTVHRTAKGSAADTNGEVEFTARYLAGDRLCSLHETSGFERVDDRWLYTTGEADRSERRVERNEPCPCGSGKKFKSCCA